MPCVRHPLEVTGIHGTDTHGHAWHPVLVVLDIYGHDPDSHAMMLIPMPCVVWHPVELLHFIAIRGSCRRRCSYHAVTGIHAADTTNQIPMPCVRHPLEVTGIHGTDTHGHAWHPILVVLDTHGHEPDTHAMMLIPMPCVVSCRIIALYCNLWPCRRQCSCSRYHEPDTHAMCPASSGGDRHPWD